MYDNILDVAETLFMQQGYQATSTRQIADTLGITQPNLYYYFKKKEEIYYHVMLRLATEVSGNLERMSSNNEQPFEEKIRNMVYYLQQRHPFNLFMMLHDIQHTLSPDIADKLFVLWTTSYKKPFIELLTESKLQLRSNIDPEFAVSQLFISISSYFHAPQKKGQIDRAIDLFLYGILDE